MSNCRDILELLDAWVDGEVTGPEAARLKEHLAGCEMCRRELEELERVWTALGVLADVEPPEGLEDLVMARVARGRRRRLMPAWGYAASAAAVVTLAVGVGQFVLGGKVDPGKSIDPETMSIVRNLDVYEDLDTLKDLDLLEMGEALIFVSQDIAVENGEGGES